MDEFTQLQIKDTLKLIESSIVSCEKVQPKLQEGSASLTISKNRIKALSIAKDLLMNKETPYSKEELEKAAIQITSIKNKSTTGINHATEGTPTFTRFLRIITAMNIVIQYLQCAIQKQQ